MRIVHAPSPGRSMRKDERPACSGKWSPWGRLGVTGRFDYANIPLKNTRHPSTNIPGARPPPYISLALVVLLAFLWGSGYALTKVAVETIAPLTVAAGRGLIGGLVLAAVLGPRLHLLWSTGTGGGVYF